MNHKRGRPKNQRAGCLMCKPHKMNGAKDVETIQEKAAEEVERPQGGGAGKYKAKGRGYPRWVNIRCGRCGKHMAKHLYNSANQYHSDWRSRVSALCASHSMKAVPDERNTP